MVRNTSLFLASLVSIHKASIPSKRDLTAWRMCITQCADLQEHALRMPSEAHTGMSWRLPLSEVRV